MKKATKKNELNKFLKKLICRSLVRRGIYKQQTREFDPGSG